MTEQEEILQLAELGVSCDDIASQLGHEPDAIRMIIKNLDTRGMKVIKSAVPKEEWKAFSQNDANEMAQCIIEMGRAGNFRAGRYVVDEYLGRNDPRDIRGIIGRIDIKVINNHFRQARAAYDQIDIEEV